jgi:hypothetical protein
VKVVPSPPPQKRGNIWKISFKKRNKNIGVRFRGTNEFKKCYQPGTNLLKLIILICLQIPTLFWLVEELLLLAAAVCTYVHTYIHGVNDSGQTEMHTAEPLVPALRCFEFEIAIEKLERYKSRVIITLWQICSREEVIHCVLRSTNLLILFAIWKYCQNSGRNVSLYLFIRSVLKLTVVINEECICYQAHTELYPTFVCL